MFFKPTVDSILSTFTRTVAKLEAHATAKHAESVAHMQASEAAYDRAIAARTEAKRAGSAADRINALTL